jgi:UDPglucose--hexose-1-phosphate uridylyltransferase
MSVSSIAGVLRVYKSRQRNAMMDPRIHFASIFRDHGAKAGDSIIHPHAQLFASPMIPLSFRQKYEVASEHLDRTGRCLYSDIREAEFTEQTRLISDIDGYTSFVPFAARLPYEIMLLPHKPEASFAQVDDSDMHSLARAIHDSLQRLKAVLGEFDYNLIIDSAPRDQVQGSYLWNVRILPRMDSMSGFEMSTGMAINILPPELAAERLRAIDLTSTRELSQSVSGD